MVFLNNYELFLVEGIFNYLYIPLCLLYSSFSKCQFQMIFNCARRSRISILAAVDMPIPFALATFSIAFLVFSSSLMGTTFLYTEIKFLANLTSGAGCQKS